MKKIVILLLFVMVFITACNKLPNDNSNPTNWDVNIYLPIIKDGLSAMDLFDNPDNLIIDSLSLPGVFSLKLDTFSMRTSAAKFLTDVAVVDFQKVVIPVESGDKTGLLPFQNDESYIDSIHFVQGDLLLSVENTTTGNATFTFEILGSKTSSGKSYIINIALAAGEKSEKIYSIAGVSYSTREFPDDKNGINLAVSAEYEDNESEAKIPASVSLGNTKAIYASGIMLMGPAIDLSESMAIDIDSNIREFSEELTVMEPELSMIIDYIPDNHNDIIDVVLYNNHLYGRKQYSTSEFELQDNLGNPIFDSLFIINGDYETRFNSTNSNIIDLFNYMPDSLSLKSMAQLYSNNEYGIIKETDTLVSSFLLSLGNKFKIDGLRYRDTAETIIPVDIRDVIEDSKLAEFIFEFDNSMQLVISMTLNFMDENYSTMFSRDLTADESMTVDITDFRHTKNTVLVEGEDLQKLKNLYYVEFDLLFQTTGDDASMILHEHDSLKLSSRFRLLYNLDLED